MKETQKVLDFYEDAKEQVLEAFELGYESVLSLPDEVGDLEQKVVVRGLKVATTLALIEELVEDPNVASELMISFAVSAKAPTQLRIVK